MVYILISVPFLIAFEKGMLLRYVSGFNHLPKCYFLLEGKLKAQAEKKPKNKNGGRQVVRITLES